ncbi:hypothetical protein [Herbinix luporum]|jgi:hypothetical protein|uniref:AAA domain-containing protein n=1 Tax=Herbinix luporum TaxID=1679721 RepID=A0A0K8J2J3_9FIRM|nr:hypothetical protein [Herbinix luporum]CUH91717.1 hypothetical protein SD1D_0163 [Herbinix luporum]
MFRRSDILIKRPLLQSKPMVKKYIHKKPILKKNRLKKPILLNKLQINKSYEAIRTIGLLGVNRGVGVTYTGMLLAYYYATEKGFKTAYLECNNHMDFQRLQEAYEWSREDEKSFSLDNITYFKQVTKKQLVDILSEDYECYILDFGTDFISSKEEFIRCDKKVIIGDNGVWNLSKMLAFLKSLDNIKGSKSWIYMIPFADRRVLMGMKDETDRFFFKIPFESDFTNLSKESFTLFHKLFD